MGHCPSFGASPAVQVVMAGVNGVHGLPSPRVVRYCLPPDGTRARRKPRLKYCSAAVAPETRVPQAAGESHSRLLRLDRPLTPRAWSVG
jgi:hypothetical protein